MTLIDVLKLFVGLEMWAPARSVGLFSIQIGNRSSGINDLGKYAIHTQCSFRFCHNSDLVSGRTDFYYPKSDSENSDFNWKSPNTTLFDEKVDSLFASIGNSVISGFRVGLAGYFRIVCGNGLVFEVFPNDSEGSEDWRIIEFGVSHIVCCANSISISEDIYD